MIQRYSAEWDGSDLSYTKDDGRFVLYADHLATLEAAVKEKDEELLILNKAIQEIDGNWQGQREQVADLEADYQHIIKEILLCDPVSACDRPDAILEPPWEVVKRMREQIVDLTIELFATRDDRDKWQSRAHDQNQDNLTLTAANAKQAEEIGWLWRRYQR